MSEQQFDVFLCHNSKDKPAVRDIAERLRDNGLNPWLDAEQLQPGLPWQPALEDQMKQIPAAAVFVGDSGLGPWQETEQRLLLHEFVTRKCPVIPVILPTCKETPELPGFLGVMTWVDFRDIESGPIGRLVWGITGSRQSPSRGEQLGQTWKPLIAHRLEFFPRDDLLRELDGLLIPGARRDVAVLGDAGAGKTRIVSEYQHLHRGGKRYRHILSVTADSEENFERGLREVAKRLFDTTLPGTEGSAAPLVDSMGQQDSVTKLQDFMTAKSGWLMVIDNLIDINLLRHFVPAERKGGHVLITIRPGRGVAKETAKRETPANIDLAIDAVLDVKSMSTEQGARFLLWSAGILKSGNLTDESNPELKHALTFSADVGGLPLMLSATGRFIGTALTRNPRDGVATFTEAYRSHLVGPKLRDEFGKPGPDYPDSAAGIVRTIIQRIQSKKELVHLLTIAAFLPPDSIPAPLFTKGAGTVGELLGPVAQVPGGASLTLNEACDTGLLVANGDGTYRMHRVWQQILRDNLGDEAQQKLWAERAIDLIYDVFPGIEFANAAFLADAEELNDWLQLAPLSLCSRDLVERYTIRRRNAGRLLHRGAQLHSHFGHLDAAMSLAKCAAKILESQADNPPSTELGSCYALLAIASAKAGHGDRLQADYMTAKYLKKADRIFQHPRVDKNSFFYSAWQRTRPHKARTSYEEHLRLMMLRIRRLAANVTLDINWLGVLLPSPEEIGILNQAEDPFGQQWLADSFELLTLNGKQRTRAFGWLLGMQSDTRPNEAERLLREAAEILKQFSPRKGLLQVYDTLATLYMFSDPPRLHDARRAIAEFAELVRESGMGGFLAYCHIMTAITCVLEGDTASAKKEMQTANNVLSEDTGRPVLLQKQDRLVQYCIRGIHGPNAKVISDSLDLLF